MTNGNGGAMESLMTWRRKLALWVVTILAAGFAWGSHVFYVGGWCGYYDGGPQGEQVEFCEERDEEELLIALVPAALIVLGAVAASFPRGTQTALAWWIFGLFLALIFWFVVPFRLNEDPAYPVPWMLG